MHIGDHEELYLTELCSGSKLPTEMQHEFAQEDDTGHHPSGSIENVLEDLSKRTEFVKKTDNGAFRLTEQGRDEFCNSD